jgi:N,N'-diacetylchitobiose transport system permease protein
MRPKRSPDKGTTTARKPRRFSQGKRALEPWLYLAPAFIVLIALLGYPIFQLINVSLYDYRQAQVSGKAPLNFVGLENYQKLFADPQFWTVLGNTVVFATACVVFTLLVGSSLAVLATRLRPWVRSMLFVVSLGAWATPAVTGSAVWLFLFDPTLGLVNKTLVSIGLSQFEGYSWTYDKWSAFGLVASEVVWCSFPFVLVTVYAGIQAIPDRSHRSRKDRRCFHAPHRPQHHAPHASPNRDRGDHPVHHLELQDLLADLHHD